MNRPASAPVSQPAAPPLVLATHERLQPAANDFDVPQGAPAKFDLGLERANIPQRRGRDDKAVDAILKTAERRPDKIHFHSPLRAKNRTRQTSQLLTAA
jgi:hypothetical protein